MCIEDTIIKLFYIFKKKFSCSFFLLKHRMGMDCWLNGQFFRFGFQMAAITPELTPELI